MCDDDVEAPTETLVDLINVAGPPNEPRIAVLPCLVRGTRSAALAGEGNCCRAVAGSEPAREHERSAAP